MLLPTTSPAPRLDRIISNPLNSKFHTLLDHSSSPSILGHRHALNRLATRLKPSPNALSHSHPRCERMWCFNPTSLVSLIRPSPLLSKHIANTYMGSVTIQCSSINLPIFQTLPFPALASWCPSCSFLLLIIPRTSSSTTSRRRKFQGFSMLRPSVQRIPRPPDTRLG